DDLECDIIHHNIADKPIYEALSYTWATQQGDVSLSQSIACGDTGEKIPIPKNCDAALRYLRLKGSQRVLWVDAICINQHDVPEWSHQVNFMGTIYSSASQVLMFLGHQSHDDDEVLCYLDGAPLSRQKRDSKPEKLAVQRFIKRRYFDRVWTLQEIALAKLVTL
ncbi:heterokaryon incompatibility, partial [Setomelanomma holmii]